MSGFDTWGGTAGSVADSHGLDRSIFFGLIDYESSWNPNADAPGSSAYGFTQLLSGTASGLGVNRFDPVQNLNGGAAYLSSLLNRYGGNYTKALAAYHDGPGAIGLHGGFQYAQTVLSKAKGYLQTGKHLLGLDKGAGAILNAAVPGLGSITDGLGVTGSCDWFCQFKQWILDSGFFKRLALAILAFIILAAAFALIRGAINHPNRHDEERVKLWTLKHLPQMSPAFLRDSIAANCGLSVPRWKRSFRTCRLTSRTRRVLLALPIHLQHGGGQYRGGRGGSLRTAANAVAGDHAEATEVVISKDDVREAVHEELVEEGVIRNAGE
jgi:hypothetical protein